MPRNLKPVPALVLLVFVLFSCTKNSTKSFCAENGTIGSEKVLNPTQGFEISFQYYLPPCYQKQTNRRFPVIYLLTMPFESRLDASSNTPMSLADRLIEAGKLPPVMIIVPKDTVAQGYHHALAIDLVSYVDEKFRTIPDGEHRGVGGISHGAAIASRMAFEFPNTFGSLGVLSGGIAWQEKDVFDGWIALTAADSLPRIRIDVGAQDGILPLTQNLVSVLDKNQIPYTLNIEEGNHNWAFWSARMESYLLWFADVWE